MAGIRLREYPPGTAAGVGANYLAACESAKGEDAATAREAVRGLRTVMRGESPEFTLEYACHSPEEERWFVLRATRFAGEGPVCAVIAHSDITERKRLEERLRQAAKMEAIGQLASGVAHDFNNILATILLHLGLLRQNHQLAGDTEESLKEMETETMRATSLTRQLLVFSRREVAHPKPMDFNELVRGLLKMFRRLLGEQLEVVFRASSASVWLEADAGMMEQVLMNLCINGRDAMPGGGVLTIETVLVGVCAKPSEFGEGAQLGQFVCLSVTDTGCGMTETVRKRIFEPFFTTKAPGKGTGLGLATVYGIVKQHQGWVEVASELGKGSSFRVYLPALTRPVSTPIPSSPPDEFKGGSEAILLVEDEQSLRRSTALFLRRLGYTVWEAANGTQALEMWRQQQPRIRLLLTDQVMPNALSGRELTERFMRDKPELKVIICSGYSPDTERPHAPNDQNLVFLPKPYSAALLARLVRQCLDQLPTPAQPSGA